MEVTHYLGSLSASKNLNENVGFLLTNKNGGYCSFFSKPSSRYHGFFYFDKKSMSMYKFIENIEILGHENADSLKNWFYFIERKKGNIIESFLMPKDFNSLIYELNCESEINLLLDCKNSYDNREWGRYYHMYEDDGCIVVRFTKKTDRNEDSSHETEEYVLYLAIKSDSNYYEKNEKWVERHYSGDEERKSIPFKRHVYNALRLKGTKFVFSISKTQSNATKECNHIFSNLDGIKKREKERFLDIMNSESIKKTVKNEKITNDVKIAYVTAVNALNKLIIYDKIDYGVVAGLPWFYQFWARDTLISLKALLEIDSRLAERIFFDYLNKIGNDGRLANLAGVHASSSLGSADAIGWLFLRSNTIIEEISKNRRIAQSLKKLARLIKNKEDIANKMKNHMEKCDSDMQKREDDCHYVLYEIECSLEKSLNCLLKFHTKGNFEVNDSKETWMDTNFEGDGRKGARIEMQALRLNMYKIMFELTQNQKYKVLENVLKEKVREKFWNGNILADGIGDFTIRPNIFIAAYAYPELLLNEEWQICFENALSSLWLEWGGLSTIDKSSSIYSDIDTGEDIKSYHRGNSWFWINNLAALALSKINKNRFNKNIQKIIEASAEEILWKGCIGCHSEISSAKQLESKGCFNQAWSNAMFIEMVGAVFR